MRSTRISRRIPCQSSINAGEVIKNRHRALGKAVTAALATDMNTFRGVMLRGVLYVLVQTPLIGFDGNHIIIATVDN